MWFEPLTAWVVALFTTGLPMAKEKIDTSMTPSIPAENWANKELYDKDRASGMSVDERMRNVRKGKYRLVIQYAEPHRDPESNKVIIENDELYKDDIRQYGAYQAHKWVQQGKYNLNKDELQIRNLQIEKKFINLYSSSSKMTDERKAQLKEINDKLAASNWDYRNTEGLKQWQQAHDANVPD